MTEKVAAVGRSSWEKLLARWCPMPMCGEAKLVIAVLADGIMEREATRRFFDSEGFDLYCRLIDLDPVFVREQVARHDDAVWEAA